MKLTDLKPGDRLTDFEFWECIPTRAFRIIRHDEAGLFVKCRDGQHYLVGQEGDDGELCGCEVASLAPRP